MPRIAPASLAEGERIYAVGDVHGRLDRLDEIHDMISDDLIGRPTQSPTIIHLGDYIDRGPDSAAVLSRLAEPIARIAHVKIVNLMGNHEAMFLAALNGEPGAFRVWVRNGGDTCLQSWGVDRMSWKGLVPQEHIRFIESLHLMHIQGGYVFVHAGIRPNFDINEQRESDLYWIRDPFLDYDGSFSHVVVHGHTPDENGLPVVRHNRIGIDTGAVFGGPLTCVVLERNQMRFLASGVDTVMPHA